jgi:membrane associated rhomboid family serine protease
MLCGQLTNHDCYKPPPSLPPQLPLPLPPLPLVQLGSFFMPVGLLGDRLFTSAIFHGGLLHMAMNMLAFVPIGSDLERHYGSFKFASIILLLILFGDATYIGVSYLLTFMYDILTSKPRSCFLLMGTKARYSALPTC